MTHAHITVQLGYCHKLSILAEHKYQEHKEEKLNVSTYWLTPPPL